MYSQAIPEILTYTLPFNGGDSATVSLKYCIGGCSQVTDISVPDKAVATTRSPPRLIRKKELLHRMVRTFQTRGP